MSHFAISVPTTNVLYSSTETYHICCAALGGDPDPALFL